MNIITRFSGVGAGLTEPTSTLLPEERDVEAELRFLQRALDGPALDAANEINTPGVVDLEGDIDANDQMSQDRSRRRRFSRVNTRLTAFLAMTTLTSGLLVALDRSEPSDELIFAGEGPSRASIDATTSLSSPITPGSIIHVDVTAPSKPPVTEASTTTSAVEKTTTSIVVTTVARPATPSSIEIAPTPTVPKTVATTVATTPPRVTPETTSPTTTVEPARPEFRYMSPGDFVRAWYNAQPQPGTVYGEKPDIYGDPEADAYIRRIAESRGYRLQPLSTSDDFNWRTTQAFDEMAAAAWEEAGVGLEIVSGYRSPDTQREIFQSSIIEYFGRTPTSQEILSGAVDDAINETFDQRSAPGYSRHHSGYVVDINRLDNSFRNTAAYRWLSANNFYNARRFGFVPSYPEGVQAGPQPESWEFAYIVNESSVQ